MNSRRVLLFTLGVFIFFLACVDPKTRSQVERQREETRSTLETLQKELEEEEENIERLKKEIELAESEYHKSQEEETFVVILPEGEQKSSPALPESKQANTLQKIWVEDSIATDQGPLGLRHLLLVQQQPSESLVGWMSQFVSENSLYTSDYFIRFMQFSGRPSANKVTEVDPVDLYILVQPNRLESSAKTYLIRGLYSPQTKRGDTSEKGTYLLLNHGLLNRKTDSLWIDEDALRLTDGRP